MRCNASTIISSVLWLLLFALFAGIVARSMTVSSDTVSLPLPEPLHTSRTVVDFLLASNRSAGPIDLTLDTIDHFQGEFIFPAMTVAVRAARNPGFDGIYIASTSSLKEDHVDLVRIAPLPSEGTLVVRRGEHRRTEWTLTE